MAVVIVIEITFKLFVVWQPEFETMATATVELVAVVALLVIDVDILFVETVVDDDDDDDLVDERFFDDKRLLRGVRRIDDLNDP